MPEFDKHARPTKLLWIDLEMTGLDAAQHVIIEVAAVVTDFDFNVIAEYSALVSQPEEKLEAMNEWSKMQHEQSGLTARVRSEGVAETEVRTALAGFIRQHFAAEPAILAGNSIHKDREFIQRLWPDVDALLHYRMLDVSSLKVFMQGKYGVEFEKKETHRAVDDIHESIAEWQYYLEWLRRHPAA